MSELAQLFEQKNNLHKKIYNGMIKYSSSKTPRLFAQINDQILEEVKIIISQIKNKQLEGYKNLNYFFNHCDYKVSNYELRNISKDKIEDFAHQYLIVAANFLFKNYDNPVFCKNLYEQIPSKDNLFKFFNNLLDYMIVNDEDRKTQNEYAFDVQYNYFFVLFKGGMELSEEFNIFDNKKISLHQLLLTYKNTHPVFIEEIISGIDEIKIETSISKPPSKSKFKL